MKVFVHSTGHCGSTWLSTAFQENALRGVFNRALCHGERTSFIDWMIHNPHQLITMSFYQFGYTDYIKSWWMSKATAIEQEMGASEAEFYFEGSHPLGRMGVVESSWILGPTTVIELRRDPMKVLETMIRRRVMGKVTNRWIFYIDPSHQHLDVNPNPFFSKDVPQVVSMAWWYIHEVYARAERYRKLVSSGETSVTWKILNLEDIQTPSALGALFESLGLRLLKEPFVPEPDNVTQGPKEPWPETVTKWLESFPLRVGESFGFEASFGEASKIEYPY
jgi:hypothetical protein